MPYNVLIVDDSGTMRNVIKTVLGLTGISFGNCLEAANGQEAMAVLENNWVDLILSDINMPVMDGFGLLRVVKSQPSFQDVPVLLITTESNEKRLQEAMPLQRSLAPRSPNVYAIDISEPMLLRARERCRDIPGVYFVRGDAERLSQYVRVAFDGIFYTASIFLLPRFCDSLRQASRLLLPGGVLSISYYAGLFDEHHEEALPKVFPDLKYQYGAFPYAELVFCLDSIPELKTTKVDYRFEVNREFLFDFLSIPAQSAGLFPKLSYLERIPKVRELCDGLAGKVSPLFMGWKFLISRKPVS